MSDQRDYNVEYWTKQEQFHLKQLEENPSKAIANHIGLACAYEIMSRYDDCFYHCNKVLELSKSDFEIGEAHIWMGRAYQDKKEFNPAIAHFLKTIEVDPEHDAAIDGIAECYMELKDFANAEYWYHRLEEIEGNEENAWMPLANFYYETKDFDRAMAYYEKWINKSVDNVEAICGKGRCLAEKKLYPEAIKIFNEAAELHPEDALPQYYLGVCYQDTDDQYRAMHHYMKALEIDPNFAEAYNNVGKLYFDFDGDVKTAVDYLEKALEHVNNKKLKQMIYINLARLNKKVANDERADYYTAKLMEDLGFGDISFGDEDDEDDEEEDI